jgi:membrane-associated phospholipid phosphatase
MTIFISFFGIAGRFAGDLLITALGWASSLLFGRVPRTHQIFLVLMMAFSFLWLILVLGLLVPSVASFMLSATPHPPSINEAWLAVVLVLGVLLLPLAVGVAGYLVPAEGERPGGWAIVRDILRGYLLTPLISGLLIFLAGVGMIRKARSRGHGWSDIHVPIVVKPGGYDQLVRDLGETLDSAGLPAPAEEAPWVLTLPARLLTAVAGGNVRKLRPDRLMELEAPTLRVGVYPSDIAISGPTWDRVRARAAILSRLATTAAHLTTSEEAQKVEDQIATLAALGGAAGGSLPAGVHAAFKAIDESLLELAVPTDQWDILYRLRLEVERDLLIGAKPGTEFPKSSSSEPAAVAPTAQALADASPAGRVAARWLGVARWSLLGLTLLTVALIIKVVIPFDQPLLALAQSWDSWSAFWDAVSQSANIPLIAIAGVFVIWLLFKKRRREALLVILLFAAATGASEGLKALVARPRPEGGGAGIPGVVFSYPSGHELETLMILGIVVLRFWRGAKALWARAGATVLVAIEVVLVGIARVALSTHFPSDVLAGLLGGFGVLGLYAWWTRAGAWADHSADDPAKKPLPAQNRAMSTRGDPGTIAA